jgi:EAL domain-containing protein (putative c-di-GMP-specific phosphodiesterase class I)
MDVTAEGIETAEQVDDLRDLACQYGQGYFFFKPLTRDDARAVLQSHGCSSAS